MTTDDHASLKLELNEKMKMLNAQCPILDSPTDGPAATDLQPGVDFSPPPGYVKRRISGLTHGTQMKNTVLRTRLISCNKNLTAAGILITLVALLAQVASASEDEPRRPFAQWADVPKLGELIAGALYEQSEAYYIWAGNQRNNITIHTSDGESYGIDIRQGYFTLDYGLTERWAADLNFGATTVGWRSFDPGGGVKQTTGAIDTTLGVRYQIFCEGKENAPWLPTWLPTMTFRAGGILPGTYDRTLPFAPGNHGAVIEPSLLLRKHLLWPGFGLWGDALYRWEHTIGADQYIVAAGFFQQICRWELDAGFRHLQAIAGSDISLIPPAAGNPPPWDGINYKVNVREVSDSVDAGFSYTTRRGIRWAFHARKTFDGSNTDSKLWLGGSIDIPFEHVFGRGKTTQ